jgi:DNA-binding NtrC family response regulator
MSELSESKKAILIVEDDVNLLEAMASSLNHLSNQIFTAENGQQALGVLKNNPHIVAILSDIRMPIMSGLELLASIRSSFNPIPFIVLTAYGDGESFQEAVRLDATDFLAKPIDEDLLQNVMTRAIEFGTQMRTVEMEIEKMIQANSILPEQKEAFRRAKRTVYSMRIGSSLYLKKPKAG